MKCFGTCQFLRGLWMDITGTAAGIHMRDFPHGTEVVRGDNLYQNTSVTAAIAGERRDQKLAAIITPPVNPNAISSVLRLEFLKKKTITSGYP